MHRSKRISFFSYPVSRPYPFGWFTYVTAIGGIICAVLFSFVALAADGYNLDLQYILHLNQTLENSYWFDKAPFSWISKTSVSCQPALLTTGATYFTSNLGFTYRLDKLWHDGSNRILPAVAYQNALLEDCQVLAVELDFLRRDQTVKSNNWWTWGMTTASATVMCGFQTSLGAIKANFTIQLPSTFQLMEINTGQPLLLSTDIFEHADMWFGAQLALGWYQQLPIAMSYQQVPQSTKFPNTTWDGGVAVLSRNLDTDDYTSLDFFHAQAYFYTNNGGLSWIRPPNTTASWNEVGRNSDQPLPNIVTTLDVFAKSFYSLLLSDFGVQDNTNALITPSGVKWLQNQVDFELENKDNTVTNGQYTGHPHSIPNAVNRTGHRYAFPEIYQSVVHDLGGPPDLDATNSSTIFMQYLCSIPQQKSGGALFFAVLLADLVFLQAVWTLLNTGATWWLQRKYREANYCEGCWTGEAQTSKRKISDYQPIPAQAKQSRRNTRSR